MIKVTYLEHSGFLVETEKIYCLFDYYKGSLPQWNREKKMAVFVSHTHYDHFSGEIFGLREVFPEIRFILSADIEPAAYLPHTGNVKATGERDGAENVSGDRNEGDIVTAAPNEEIEVFGMKITTLRSNDEGVAYVVRCGSRTIYHAGDLNWWHWEDETEAFNKMMRRTYQSEINKLQHEKIDVAFVPVDPRLGEQYCWGIDCFMKRTDTKYVFPMHFWGNYKIFDRLMLEKCTEEYKDKIMKIERTGQTFLLDI